MNSEHKDGFQGNRLFLKQMEKVGLHIKDFGFFRENVIWIKTPKSKFVLKGFRRKESCEKQWLLSQFYSENGSRVMGTYTRFPNQKKWVSFGNYYWLLMPFYKGESLHFGSKYDCTEGINAISRFHHVSKRVPSSVYYELSTYSLYKKWKERFETFKEIAHHTKWSQDIEPLIPDIIMMGEWSLKNFDHEAIKALEKKSSKKREICHGDVAPHNFVLNRERNEEAYLIDFDLFAAVPHAYDWLQYANRILPFYRWSFGTIEKMSNRDFIKWFYKRWFVICLVFPTDLYREWNRALKANDESLIEQVTNFTLRDMPYRMRFVNRIISKINEDD